MTKESDEEQVVRHVQESDAACTTSVPQRWHIIMGDGEP